MWTLFFVQLLGLISPGPDFFYVCHQAMAKNRRAAMLGAVGIALGVGFWALLVIFGLAFLNQIFPQFQLFLMVFGGCYLAYNGIKMVQITQSQAIHEDQNAKDIQTKTFFHDILSGLAINLANPKVIVFFSSVLSAYISNLHGWINILNVLFILMGSTLVWFLLVALLFSQKKIRRFYAQHNRYLDNAAGLAFIAFGFSLIHKGIQGFF